MPTNFFVRECFYVLVLLFSIRDTEHCEQCHSKVKTSSLGDTIPYTSHTVSFLPCAMEGDKYSRLVMVFRISLLKVIHCERLSSSAADEAG